MGLIIDTCIFVAVERQNQQIDFSQWEPYGNAYISAITTSELIMGIHLADSAARRIKRTAFVEAILSQITALPFNEEVARIHAEISAELFKKNKMIGAHDLIIAATALAHNCAVLTKNNKDFIIVPGLEVINL